MSQGSNNKDSAADREQSWAALDKSLAEARSAFADMTPDELESLINEAVAAARTTPAAGFIDEADVQAQWDTLINEVERGGHTIITREGKAAAVMIPLRSSAQETKRQSEPEDLASAIRRRLAPLGGIDNLEPHPPVPIGEPFSFQAGIDSGPGVPAEEVFERLRKSLAEPLPDPAVWRKLP